MPSPVVLRLLVGGRQCRCSGGGAEGAGGLFAVPKATFAALTHAAEEPPAVGCLMALWWPCSGPGRFLAPGWPRLAAYMAFLRMPPRPAEKPGDSCRTSGHLSTEKDTAAQLFAQAAHQHNSCGTGLSLRQMPVALAEIGLVHKKAAPLLLPLCIHRTIKEQPGTTGVLRRRPCLCPQRGVV